jgi:hypothetical protein
VGRTGAGSAWALADALSPTYRPRAVRWLQPILLLVVLAVAIYSLAERLGSPTVEQARLALLDGDLDRGQRRSCLLVLRRSGDPLQQAIAAIALEEAAATLPYLPAGEPDPAQLHAAALGEDHLHLLLLALAAEARADGAAAMGFYRQAAVAAGLAGAGVAQRLAEAALARD